MKKHNLFKVIVLTFLAVVVLTWIFPAGGYSSGEFASSGRTPLGLFDLVRTPLIAFANLTQYAFVLLVIGGLYGVLNRTGAYAPLVDKLAQKVSSKRFLVVIIAILAVLQSLTGATFALVLLVPFLSAVILKKGYGKVTAMASTIGAILLGSMAATLNYEVVGSTSQYMSIDYFANLTPSIILLVLSVVIYSFIVVKTAKVQMIEIEEEIEVEEKKPSKTTSSKEKTSKTSKTKAETKGKKDVKEVKTTKKKVKKIRKELAPVEIPLYEKVKEEKGTLALSVFGIITVLFTLIAMFHWYGIFQIEFFEKLHEQIMATELFGYPLFKNVLGTVTSIGNWSNYDLIMFIMICIPVIAWIYSVKFDDVIDGFVNGAKQMAKPALYVMLATILYASMFSTTSGDNIYYTLVHALFGSREKINLILSGFTSGAGSILFSDFQSLVGSLYIPYSSIFSSFMNIAVYILQTIYGVVAFVSPGAIILVLGLSYFDVSYFEWFKYIWKFLASVVVIIGITVLSMAVIIPKIAGVKALSGIIKTIEKIGIFKNAGAGVLVTCVFLVLFVIVAIFVNKKFDTDEEI